MLLVYQYYCRNCKKMHQSDEVLYLAHYRYKVGKDVFGKAPKEATHGQSD